MLNVHLKQPNSILNVRDFWRTSSHFSWNFCSVHASSRGSHRIRLIALETRIILIGVTPSENERIRRYEPAKLNKAEKKVVFCAFSQQKKGCIFMTIFLISKIAGEARFLSDFRSFFISKPLFYISWDILDGKGVIFGNSCRQQKATTTSLWL